MALQESVHFFGQLSANPFRGGNVLNAGFTQTTDRSKSPQQQTFPVLAYTRAIVKNAFFDTLFHEQLMICVGEPMGLIANALKQPQRGRIHWEPQGQCPARLVNLLAFFGQAYDGKIVQS
jgi:hypothetical protein